MKKTLIIDCDGVIYPTTELSTAEILEGIKSAVKKLKISDEDYQKISKETRKHGKYGMFNFMNELCKAANVDFEKMCSEAFKAIDYSKIKRNKELLSQLKDIKKEYDLVIFTNNHQKHVDIVFEKVFGKKDIGIKVYDVRSTEYKGTFYPKQSEIGLRLFTKRLGVNPKDCILLDDTQRNLDCAKALGMGAVKITNDYTLGKYIKSLSGNAEKTKSR